MADIVTEAVRIVDEGQKRGILLRIMGACAVRLHCPMFRELHVRMDRVLSDLDFATYSKFVPGLKGLFVDLNYKPNERIIAYHMYTRHVYYDEVGERTADVFVDKLDFCHTVSFAGRLEVDSPTIPLADIFLEKMQIVKMDSKDLKDLAILLREHDIGGSEKETVNGDYIAKTLAGDWGFYYTVTTNLARLREFSSQNEVLGPDDRKDIAAKIDSLLATIEREPKSLGWRMRAKVGTKSKWYKEVEELGR